MIHALSALLALWLVAPEPTPPERYAQGRELYDHGRYLEAAKIFVRLHTDTGEVSVLYAAGQSFRLAGQCPDALAAYEAFVSAADHADPDLELARARVIEMRVCANRSHSDLVRKKADRLAPVDPTSAVTLLENEWQETSDPTIVPALVRLQRRLGTCDRAAVLLDKAIEALRPIEALAESAPPSSDVGTGRDTLNELQRIKSNESCIPMEVTAHEKGPPPIVSLPDRPDSTAPPRARWPTWAMAGAAVLIAAGGVSGALMYRAESDLDNYGKKNIPWDPHGTQLLQDGQRYQLGAVVLTATGVVVGATALVYRTFFGAGATSNRQTASRSAVRRFISSF